MNPGALLRDFLFAIYLHYDRTLLLFYNSCLQPTKGD
jgi:hypothetical protein